MKSIRVRLLLALLAALALAAAVMGAVTYRNVLARTEALFDYQLRQMALSLRDQGEIASDQVEALADEQLDFVVQIWTVDGRSIYASRAHSALPARALLGLADVTVDGEVWRTFSVATRNRVIQVAQPRQIRRRLAADAALDSVVPLLLLAPVMALAIWWVRQAVADSVPLAESRGTEFELFADAPLTINGDRAALAMLVRNLADNAVRYSPPGARVEVRVNADAGVATLQVDDAGPGIPPAERERVFDRFYRRNSGDEQGTGLGLAIVRSVAARHGAEVALDDSPLGGLRFTVRFPLCHA